MAKYKTIRVFPDGIVWVVKKDSATKASAIRNTKEEALMVARDIAINQGLTIIIHGKNGKIQRTVTPEKASSSDNCFITTACVKHYGLPDNCYQLQTLRKFRDNYLLKSYKGNLLVKRYYLIAPLLVNLLEIDSGKEYLFKKIFKRITSACNAIEKKEYSSAESTYKETVEQLLHYFKII